MYTRESCTLFVLAALSDVARAPQKNSTHASAGKTGSTIGPRSSDSPLGRLAPASGSACSSPLGLQTPQIARQLRVIERAQLHATPRTLIVVRYMLIGVLATLLSSRLPMEDHADRRDHALAAAAQRATPTVVTERADGEPPAALTRVRPAHPPFSLCCLTRART